MSETKRFRCPYCKASFSEMPPPICPVCGKMMQTPALRTPDPRLARRRKIEQIHRDAEMQKALLFTFSPSFWRNPKFYFGVIIGLTLLATALFQAVDRSKERYSESRLMRGIRHVDTIATALGRFHFHTGLYPTAEQGLAALVRNPKTVARWDGPYLNLLRADPWGRPFVYLPPRQGTALPVLFSCGPDRLAGTGDDIRPDPTRFEPGTEWTNGWVSESERLPGVWVGPDLRKDGNDAGETSR